MTNNSHSRHAFSGGGAIAGTVTLAGDGVALTFVPSANLAKATLYNVSVGGFNERAE